ncbi:Acylglycerol kinase, mitochondrial [Triplophysa tibetana]|uniref:Acylglycerol kinase, mitochondrial n=1 Tax=Triplophysa tibetana TaxID=1572043 RepID=A0A5A9NZ99_9TELE|nr:Acylglycerol kinase, mitochondrial [Triplophysa tibetana]
MARVVKVFRTLRNHWKKSTVAVCLLSYGGHWLYGKHCDSVLRREACLEARVFGQQLIGPQEHLKKATVILNPAACNRKANSLFEKNAAPLLHLAGMEIKIVKTDYEGQAKKLMELMDQTDILIIAGGDGTLQEETFSKIPIGFIPLGFSNSLSQSLHLVSDNKVQHITKATLSILKGVTVHLDVLQIQGEKEQPVFALSSLRWGAFRDVATKISKETINQDVLFTPQQWPQIHQASLSYMGPVPRPPDLPAEKPSRPNLLYRIHRRLKNYWNPPIEEPSKEPEPEQWENTEISTMELSVSTHNKNPVKRRVDDSMLITLEPESLTVGQFIKEGTKKAVDPTEPIENSLQLEASAACLNLPKEGAGFYDIDNEEYEAMSVEVRLLPRKLRFFCSEERKEQLAQAL